MGLYANLSIVELDASLYTIREIWLAIETLHEGTAHVRENKLIYTFGEYKISA